MNQTITECAQQVLAGENLQRGQIDRLVSAAGQDFDDLLYWSNQIRQQYFGNKIRLCSIVPGRLGGCNQDCAFCAQSARYNTHVDKTPQTLTDDEILAAAAEAKRNGVPHFGIVYSGRAVTEAELVRLERLIAKITREMGLGMCAALGIINADQARRLAAAGLTRYNHNLETSERHFGRIVTTHMYADRVAAVRAAQSAGLGICAGGIFGIGETEADRIDMALSLRDLSVDTVPMNFLHPIPGTPLGDTPPLSPREILTIIALYRFILPRTNLKVAGGRTLNLRDLQSWIFKAGATSILTGNYLTTAGRSAQDDLQMLHDLGMETF
ncbi:MAG: biotin synthase BioB [Phycisphaerae bacterium]|nr:biotin synthase BioB [Phycisphaerae bacterium]